MKKVLIVEDEFVSRQLLMALLGEHFDVCHTQQIDRFCRSPENHLSCAQIDILQEPD